MTLHAPQTGQSRSASHARACAGEGEGGGHRLCPASSAVAPHRPRAPPTGAVAIKQRRPGAQCRLGMVQPAAWRRNGDGGEGGSDAPPRRRSCRRSGCPARARAPDTEDAHSGVTHSPSPPRDLKAKPQPSSPHEVRRESPARTSLLMRSTIPTLHAIRLRVSGSMYVPCPLRARHRTRQRTRRAAALSQRADQTPCALPLSARPVCGTGRVSHRSTSCSFVTRSPGPTYFTAVS